MKYLFGLLFLLSPYYAITQIPTPDYSVSWNSSGTDHKGSMPAGNGDIGLNLWVEGGDIVFLLSKTDSWTENGQLVKLGRVRLKFDQPVFTNSPDFKQILLPKQGTILVKGTSHAQLKAWVDANAPVVHLEFSSDRGVQVKAICELWRTAARVTLNKSVELSGQGTLREQLGIPAGKVVIDPDSVLKAGVHQISWLHRNSRSLYPLTFQNQHLESLLPKYPDPLLHKVFGAVMKSGQMIAADNQTLRTARAEKKLQINLYCLTRQGTPGSWNLYMKRLMRKYEKVPVAIAQKAHEDWWRKFWNRSWIHVSGDENAAAVTQSYAMQRWMTGASGRGAMAIKYNGGIFTVGQEPSSVSAYDPAKGQIDADFRGWGGNYWFQNNRLLYWPMITAGDHDLLRPFLNMYIDALPLAKDRVRIYDHHDGAVFPETINFWGLPNNNDFGWNNPGTVMTNTWIKRYISGGLELSVLALTEYQYTRSAAFLKNTLLPLAVAVTTYYDQHYQRVNRKIRLDPAQSLETRQEAVDPAPDIAGLKYLLPRLLALPKKYTTTANRKVWSGMLTALPELPVGYTDSTGKHPEFSTQQNPKGKRILLDAGTFVKAKNVENPELYSVFPFTLYGLRLPDLQLARDTYEARLFPASTCWSQDGIQAAILGLADEAQKEVIANFTAYGKERFKWFWTKGHDWEPDLDNGGAGQLILQSMLLQTRNEKILLFPAWPKQWDVSFKLHAPGNTVISCVYKHGKIIQFDIVPKIRQKDIVVINK